MNCPKQMSYPRTIMLFLVCYCLLSGQALAARVINITAEKFRYVPDKIEVEQGEEVELHIRSKDRLHGFSLPDLNIREDILPGKVAIIKFTAGRSGRFGFLCDIFCGSGHGGMRGEVVVLPDY